MTFFKTLFARKSHQPKLSPDFSVKVEKAIHLLVNANSNLDDQQFIKLLVDNGIDKPEAIEILLFLPIAFVRQWLTDVKWLDTYIEYINERKQIKHIFRETASYMIISKVVKTYFQSSPSGDVVLKIGGRSAEFHAMNQLLNKYPRAELHEIELSPTIITR
ncbi:MAG TPA: hypothetical protein VNS32_10290 [Flavisolibacter sp.]|nr:hypothetical protein [Flavisolibacter sp.]